MGADHSAPRQPVPAGLVRRMLSLGYELLLLTAVWFAATLPFLLATHAVEPVLARPLLQVYLLLITAAYFVWQWTHGGQTLPMKVWRIKLVTRENAPLTARQGIFRFVFGAVGLSLLGLGFVWGLIDRDRQFLHDRLTGTKIVMSAE